jgi:hypothetical protein
MLRKGFHFVNFYMKKPSIRFCMSAFFGTDWSPDGEELTNLRLASFFFPMLKKGMKKKEKKKINK